MGFSYCQNKLVCDICGNFGGVIKKKCPVGLCATIAAHPECYKKRGGTKHYHSDCRQKSGEYYSRKQKFIDENKNNFVVLAAWGPKNTCHAINYTPSEVETVVFAGLGGRTIDWQYPEVTGYFKVGKYDNTNEFGMVLDGSAIKIGMGGEIL